MVSYYQCLNSCFISNVNHAHVFFRRVSEFACHISGCTTVFSTLQEYEHHYNSLHRNVCCSCHHSLPTARLLDIHIQEWHDSLFTILAENQDMVSFGNLLGFSTTECKKYYHKAIMIKSHFKYTTTKPTVSKCSSNEGLNPKFLQLQTISQCTYYHLQT